MAADQIKRHVLPGEPHGETAWFDNQNAFEQKEIRRHVLYKRRAWPTLPDGLASKHPTFSYPHILPQGNERLSLYPGLADEILSYLEAEGIAAHSELLNLKSSQAACLSFLFPLRRDLALACQVLGPLLGDAQAVTAIEFEYTGPEGATDWLGEPPGGGRGQNRTSIDVAFWWTDNAGKRHLTLGEWKYTERGFGTCSAFDKAGTGDKDKCRGLAVAKNRDPQSSCLLVGGGPNRDRKYWAHMKDAGIDLSVFEEVRGCPFSGPFYQLMRQFLLAAYLRQAHEGLMVDVVSIGFSGNTFMHAVPKALRVLGADDIVEAWNATLDSVPPLRHLEVEQLMASYDLQGPDPEWRTFIRDRYGV